ncbi:hypothetical protein BUALT_Bualt07G0164500 [Buddleja alternifolia]|uniref:AB hydrolase-1 domain-containing protein n=1 Tax=Buddleja alternifolia TaxID=168488 RepID=A0AAV6XBB3_9LAMI|nr:hypothetical protein BUALT_Bualt07G0164500 [Buddleja alternifolia]
MEALRQYLRHLLAFYLSVAAAISHYLFPKIQRFPIFVPIIDKILSLYFTFGCNLVQCTVDLDDQTTMHFWAPAHRRFDKPNLMMIHGYGGDPKWQFVYQVKELAESFNLYIPDLLFFGKSHTTCPNRSEAFQAECVGAGLKGLGVGRCSVYAISYGGYVGYRMAEMHPEMMEKVVIVSSGVGCTEDQKREQLKNVGCNALDLLLPDNPAGLRLLMETSVYKFIPFKYAPDFVLQEFIDAMCNNNRKGKQELVEHLLANKADFDVQTITQETLLIWGDKDKIFPLSFAHQLIRKLGPKAKLEVIPDSGHAVNIDAPGSLNALIKGFILHGSKSLK